METTTTEGSDLELPGFEGQVLLPEIVASLAAPASPPPPPPGVPPSPGSVRPSLGFMSQLRATRPTCRKAPKEEEWDVTELPMPLPPTPNEALFSYVWAMLTLFLGVSWTAHGVHQI